MTPLLQLRYLFIAVVLIFSCSHGFCEPASRDSETEIITEIQLDENTLEAQTYASDQETKRLEAEVKDKSSSLLKLETQSKNQILVSSIAIILLMSVALMLLIYINKYKIKKLRENQKTLETYFDSSIILMCIANTQGYFLKVNKLWSLMLGYNLDDLDGKLFLDLVHPDDLPSTLQAMSSLSEGKTVIDFQNRFLKSDGSYILLNWRSASDGKLIFATAQDLSEKDKIQKKLSDVTEILEQTSRIAKVGGYEVDMTTQKAYWSDQTKAIHEVDPDYKPVLSEAINFYKEGFHREEVQRLVNRAITLGEPWEFELILVTAKGNERWVRATGNAEIRDGKCVRLYGTFQDIDQEKRLRIELEKTKSTLISIFNEMKDVVWSVSVPEQKMLFITPSAEDLYGISVEEWMQDNTWWEKVIHPEDAWVVQNINTLLFEKGTYHVEYRIFTRAGVEKWVSNSGKLIRNEQGVPLRIDGIISDISERKIFELTILESRKKAEDANKAKSEFLANMSHEIRTPLNSIIGFSELIENTPLSAEQQEFSKAVRTSSLALIDLINDILDFSKFEAGRLDLHIHKVNIRELMGGVERIMRNSAVSKQLHFELLLDDQIPDFVFADEVRIRQVLINLLSNAVKFTSNGYVRCSVSTENIDLKVQEAILHFRVEDSGVGISEESLGRIFEAFGQEDATITRNFGGTGLGLTISNNLLKLMDTKLEVKSKKGEGSTFWFNLTVKFESSPQQRYDTSTSHNSVSSELIYRRFKILIADDNAINRLLAKSMMKQIAPQAKLIEATNGIEAVQQFHSEQPDIILMDVQMPEKSGLDASKEIRQMVNLEQVPIIALTAGTLDDDRANCIAAGMNDFLSKPVTISELEGMLNTWLGKAPIPQKG